MTDDRISRVKLAVSALWTVARCRHARASDHLEACRVLSELAADPVLCRQECLELSEPAVRATREWYLRDLVDNVAGFDRDVRVRCEDALAAARAMLEGE